MVRPRHLPTNPKGVLMDQNEWARRFCVSQAAVAAVKKIETYSLHALGAIVTRGKGSR